MPPLSIESSKLSVSLRREHLCTLSCYQPTAWFTMLTRGPIIREHAQCKQFVHIKPSELRCDDMLTCRAVIALVSAGLECTHVARERY